MFQPNIVYHLHVSVHAASLLFAFIILSTVPKAQIEESPCCAVFTYLLLDLEPNEYKPH